jgi:glutathione S-transferase
MKLYYAPGACSLADHIAMHEAKLEFDDVKVDLKAKKTEGGEDYLAINPKGYVPALTFDDGQLLTENVAILSWVAEQDPKLALPGPTGRVRLIEMLAYITSELHKPLSRLLFAPMSGAEKDAARAAIVKRFVFLQNHTKDGYLFGSQFSVADAYLYVMLRWAEGAKLDLPAPLRAFAEKVKARPAVQLALKHEGLK